MGIFFEWKDQKQISELSDKQRSHANWYGFRLDDSYNSRAKNEQILDVDATLRKWFGGK